MDKSIISNETKALTLKLGDFMSQLEEDVFMKDFHTLHSCKTTIYFLFTSL